eukprot:scaffold114875_cov31-Attheya_sp.AAC.3
MELDAGGNKLFIVDPETDALMFPGASGMARCFLIESIQLIGSRGAQSMRLVLPSMRLVPAVRTLVTCFDMDG